MSDLSGLTPDQDDDGDVELVLSSATRERILAQSQFLNGLGVSLFATGVLGTIVAYVFAPASSDDTKFLAVVFAFCCFAGAFALHLVAQRSLGALDK